MQNFCKWFWMHERVKVNVRQPSVSKTATTHRASTKWQPGLMKHNQADPPKTSTNTRTCTVITLWTTSGSPLESSTKWRAFNFLESGNMYLYYISTFYGPQAHPFCRGFWRGYKKKIDKQKNRFNKVTRHGKKRQTNTIIFPSRAVEHRHLQPSQMATAVVQEVLRYQGLSTSWQCATKVFIKET